MHNISLDQVNGPNKLGKLIQPCKISGCQVSVFFLKLLIANKSKIEYEIRP